MACSKYEYVKKFEQVRTTLPQTYILVRVDGRGFTKFCAAHSFAKPNDLRAIKLMNAAAEHVCSIFTEIFLAYGQSDEYSFVFHKNTTLFSRRTDKILSCVVSAFTAGYVFFWPKFFDIPLKEIPAFDSRIVVYPNEQTLKDYFRWRQVDCHINNLYNTVFWCMVGKGMENREVEKILKDTNSGKKNEILFAEFGINYNKIEEIYRRGTFLLYAEEKIQLEEKIQQNVGKEVVKEIQEMSISEEKKQEVPQFISQTKPKTKKKQQKQNSQQKVRRRLIWSHEDCIREQFWAALLQPPAK